MAQKTRADKQKNLRLQASVRSVKMGNNPPVSYFYHFKLTFFVSLLAWPVTYIYNNAFEQIDQTVRPFWMMASGFLILVFVVAGVAKYSYTNDWVYYGAVLFAFTAVIDLIITLEFNGVIHNFMSEYLKLGEPYLASPWGSAIALFDGIGFYFMYLFLAHLISNGKDWRSLGIYWASGIINSMIVLILGIFSGMHSPTFCTFLNIPYVVFPILAIIRAFKTEPSPDWKNYSESKLLKITDALLTLALGGCIYITLAKGFTALAPENPGVDFLHFLEHEPSFLFAVPAPFPKIQAVVYLLYIVPIQFVSIIFLLGSRVPSSLWEVTLVHAGVMIQGQFSVIAMAFDPQTPAEYKSQLTDVHFWFYNILILIVPHLVLLRLKMCNIVDSRLKNLKLA